MMIPTTRAASTPSRSVTISASNMDGLRRARGGAGLRRLRAEIAEAGDLERVPRRHEAVGAADLGLERRDPRAHELHHPAAPGAHEVVVLLARMDVLVKESPAPQPLFPGQAALDQEVQVAVHRGAGDLQAPRLHGGE